ncbi:hypothetical protein ACLOJK_035359 [Asimina triloba]
MSGLKRKRGRKPNTKHHADAMDLQLATSSAEAPATVEPAASSDASPSPTAASHRRRGRPRKDNVDKKKPENGSIKPPSRRNPPAASSAPVFVAGNPPGPLNSEPVPAVRRDSAAAKVLPSMDAVVKVFCVHTEPNFSLPWQRKRQYSSSSSGFIIGKRRVLTNAHSVEHYTQVKLKKRGSDTKYLATVLAIGTECDIAYWGAALLVKACIS